MKPLSPFFKPPTHLLTRCITALLCICALEGRSDEHKQIHKLVDEWCRAHNNWKVHKLRLLYAGKVLYYGQWTDVEKVVAEKSSYFRPRDAFSLRIASTLTITPLTAVVKKCEFVKEVFFRGKTDRTPAYLLVLMKGYEPEILGESDLISDRRTGFSPNPEDFREFENPEPASMYNADEEEESNWFYYTLGAIAAISLGIIVYMNLARRRKTMP
jgi:hypothetical protein